MGSPFLGAAKSIREESVVGSRDRGLNFNDHDSQYSQNGVVTPAYGSLTDHSGDESEGRRGSDSDVKTVRGGSGNSEGVGLLIDTGDVDDIEEGGRTPIATAPRGRTIRGANGRGNVPQYGATTFTESPKRS